VTYQFSGELALRQKRFQQAREDFLQALKMDRFNHPGVYTGLLLIAQETGDAALQDSITKQVLETYDLDGWKIAHQGHREKLALELRPLLYDIADGLNPYQQPAATEPLYRFLVATGGEARGFFGLGIALTRLGKQEEGQRMLRQANRLDPIYPAP
jgi:tetratricopeptide (TPR) repeat protein